MSIMRVLSLHKPDSETVKLHAGAHTKIYVLYTLARHVPVFDNGLDVQLEGACKLVTMHVCQPGCADLSVSDPDALHHTNECITGLSTVCT